MNPRGDVPAGAASSKGRHLSSVRDSLDGTARSGDSGSELGLPRGFFVAVSCAWVALEIDLWAPIYARAPEIIGWLRKLIEEIAA